jgi:hypothetical protein
MTPDEKLAAILAAVQTDPGGRGLAKDPHDNLFTATAGDFDAACRGIADTKQPSVIVGTGFYIPTANPPAFETDGPLGTAFLLRALSDLGAVCGPLCEQAIGKAMDAAIEQYNHYIKGRITHVIWIERAGPAADGRCHTMRGLDITDHLDARFTFPSDKRLFPKGSTIGIGDGGNEIGMGKIPHETIVKNIPNGDLIHCRVPTDHLIVAGVSNWGAYALAAGLYVLRDVKPPADLFDPVREREILEVMVREGPLVDGKTGKQEATVDGLTWDEYVKPLVQIRKILEA